MYKKKKKNVKKFRKKFNTRIIKSKKTYSVEEIAELLSVHPNTVGTWLKTGLQKIDTQQPYLVFGQDLIDFLNARNKSKKRPCEVDQLFCCKCQEPRRSKNNIVCINIGRCRTNVLGLCEICGTKINKTISPQKVDFYRNIFNVETVHQEDLIECANTSATVKKK